MKGIVQVMKKYAAQLIIDMVLMKIGFTIKSMKQIK